MSPRRTRAAIVGQSVSTRSKAQKRNHGDEDATESIRRTRQSRRRGKSLDAKNSLEVTVKRSTRKASPDTKLTSRKSAKKTTSRRKLNLTQEVEAKDKVTAHNLSMDSNDSKILRDSDASVTERIEHDLSQLRTLKNLDSTKLNKKLQRKTKITNVRSSPIIVTPESTPPKLSLTPHRSKKTPKKSPISLGSPKTHSLTVPRLLKSPRKLSLLTTFEENLDKSDTSHNKKSERVRKEKLNDISISNKNLSTSPNTKSKHKKSDPALKKILRKFSKSPKIVLKSPKSKKSKLRKLKLSPSQVRKSSLKTPTNSDTTPDFDISKISTKGSPSPKEKKLSGIKRRLINTPTLSQEKDILAKPVVLLEKLSPEKIQNMLRVPNKTRSNSSITKSPLINVRKNSKVFETSAKSDVSINRNSNIKLKDNNIKTLSNRVSPRIKHNLLLQEEKRSSVPLMSSTPQERKMLLRDLSLTSNTSNTSINNTFTSTRSRHKNQSNISNILHTSTAIENVSQPSLFNVSDTSPFHTSNVAKRNVTYDKRNTYELEQPQTLSLQQTIKKKRTSTDANLSSKENVKRAKVHFADGKFNTSNARKSINKSIGQRPNILRNVGSQQNNIVNSAHKLRKVETPKLSRNSLVSSFKRTSPRINVVTPRVQLNGIQVTPKSFTLMEKKSEKKSSTKKVPNFGKIHEQMFAKSESLVDAKKRLEARHVAFTAKKVLPKANVKEEKRPLPTDTKDGTHNRFGFKIRKAEATHAILKKQTIPLRQKQQHVTRMTLKGIRTNRRFELQMKARNLNP